MTETLYHATRFSSLPSIMKEGLRSEFHGKIHGGMDYELPEKAVYLSRHKNSNNLNTELFNGCNADDFVVVLEIDAKQLDVDRYFPDDAFFYMLDDQFNIEESDLSVNAFVKENWSSFGEMFGTSEEKSKMLLKAFCKADGFMSSYTPIAKQMAIEYLNAQGEIAYLGDVPATSIRGWHKHPDNVPSDLDTSEPVKVARMCP